MAFFFNLINYYSGCTSSGRRELSPGEGPLPLCRLRSLRSPPGTALLPSTTERDAVNDRDSIVWHVCATLAKGKVHTHRFPGACVLNVSVQKPVILKDDESTGAVVLHANDIKLRQTETLKKDFRSLIEASRSISPATTIIVTGLLTMYRRGHERFSRLFALNKWLTLYFNKTRWSIWGTIGGTTYHTWERCSLKSNSEASRTSLCIIESVKSQSQSLLYCQFYHMYHTCIQRIEIALLSDPWCIQITLNTNSRT